MRFQSAIAWIFVLLMASPLRAQVAEAAEITSPAPGEALAGVVTIIGTASHSDFVGYDLAFAYAENPTDTWFPIGEPIHTSVVAERLALWDTTGITDGEYSLRLRVFLRDGTALSAEVDGLRVRNQTPIETSTPTATVGPGPTLTPAAAPTLPPAATPTPLQPRQSQAQTALVGGVAFSLLALAALGGYSLTRTSLRPRWAALRSRMLHRRIDRRDRRRRPQR